MIPMPSKTYLCPEGSPAAKILEELGVSFGVNVEGQREVQLDPILMIAILALQGKNYSSVSSLLDLWKRERTNLSEKT